jgi:hypothetical protein
VKYLNLYEFKNLLDLNLNFEFKSKLLKKELQSQFIFFSVQPNPFWPMFPLQPGHRTVFHFSFTEISLAASACYQTNPIVFISTAPPIEAPLRNAPYNEEPSRLRHLTFPIEPVPDRLPSPRFGFEIAAMKKHSSPHAVSPLRLLSAPLLPYLI